MRTLWNSQCDLFVVMFMLVLRSRFFFLLVFQFRIVLVLEHIWDVLLKQG